MEKETLFLELEDTPTRFECQPRLGLRTLSPATIYGTYVYLSFPSHIHEETHLTN